MPPSSFRLLADNQLSNMGGEWVELILHTNVHLKSEMLLTPRSGPQILWARMRSPSRSEGKPHELRQQAGQHPVRAAHQVGGPRLLGARLRGGRLVRRQAQQRPEERLVRMAAEKRGIHQGRRPGQEVHAE